MPQEPRVRCNLQLQNIYNYQLLLHGPSKRAMQTARIISKIGDKRIKSPEDLTCEKAVKEQVESLTIQERTVVKLIFGLDDGVSRTPNKVGQKLHLTRERIRQILKRALEKMREKEQL